MNAKRKYKVTEGSTVRYIYPINDSSIKYSYQKLDSESVYYLRRLKTPLMLSNNPKEGITDYTWLYSYEQYISTRCTEFTIDIYEVCNGVDILEFTGTFTLSEADWDADACRVTITPKSISPYECLKQQSKKAVNILDIPNVITTKADLSYNYEFYYCIGVGANLGGACVPPGPNAGQWLTFHQQVYTFNDTSAAGVCAVKVENITIYYREFIVTSCLGGSVNPPPGTGWILHTNNCGFNNTARFTRAPLAGAIVGVNPAVGYGWYNPTTGLDELPPPPATQTLTVSNTPASEDLLLWYDNMVYPDTGVSGVAITYPLSVYNNPNSTYVWSLSPLTTATATVTGTTATGFVTPTSAGVLKVRLTETHGNAYVSIKDYTFNVTLAGAGNVIPYVVIANFKIGKSKLISSEYDEYYLPAIVSATGATVVSPWNISWTSNFFFTNFLGTNGVVGQMGVPNTPFTLTALQQVSKSTGPAPTQIYINFFASYTVADTLIPMTKKIETITNLYPSEPFTARLLLTQAGTLVSLPIATWYRNNTSQGTGFVPPLSGENKLITTAPASVGSYCLAVKETINYTFGAFGYQVTNIIASINQAVYGRTPPIASVPSTSTFISYTRGRLFKEACEYVLSEMDCSVTDLVSDFFEWNPVGDAPGYVAGKNYVTGLNNKLTYLSISQKSDVVSPTSSNAATLGELTFSQVEKIWADVFNSFWFIDPLTNKMRVEHISFFNKVVAYDTTVSPLLEFNKANNKWTYDKSKMPKYEKFKYAEAMIIDFIGADIYYDSPCVDQNSESNTKERFLDFLGADLYEIYTNPADIDLRGFVLFCNNKNGTQYTVDVEQGLISTSYLANGHLSWANLHYAYHRHNRILPQGYMNNTLTSFLSTVKTKQQKNVKIKRCCSDAAFDPQDILIRTGLGDGIVDEAEEDRKTKFITATILHD